MTKHQEDWFVDWFDSPYYHILYGHRDHQEASAFIDSLMEAMAVQIGTRVLDLACGKGRHAVHLHSKGYDVHGIDLAPSSIEECKRFETAGLSFAVGDMRKELSGAPFDLVLNLFTSFGYFDTQEDNLKVLQRIKEALVPSGRFVIDYLNVTPVLNSLPKKEEKRVGEILFDINKELRADRIVKQICFQAEGKEHRHEEKIQALKLRDFKNLMRKTGVTIDKVYGSYDLDEFVEAESNRLIMVCSI